MRGLKEVIIYGSGQRGSGLYTLLRGCGIEVRYVIDTNEKRWGMQFYDRMISAPDVLLSDQQTPVCIAIAREEDVISVRRELNRRYSVSKEREIQYFELIRKLYQIDVRIQSALRIQPQLGNPQIIFECDYGLGLGGIEAWTKSICSELIEDGRKNVSIISDSGKYDIPPLLRDKVVSLPINHDEMFGAETIITIIHYLLRKLPCVVVTGQFYVTLLTACLVKQCYADKIHIISVIHFGKEELYRQYASVCPYVDLFIGVSKDITVGLLDCGVPVDKIENMTCPVTCDKVLARDYTINLQKPVRLGFAGRVNAKQKRMDLVPELVEQLDKLHVNYCLEIAGEGDYCGRLTDYIRERGLQERVKLLGRIEREEIARFWQDKDICISLSDYEGRSISIMEAMANGAVPIVTATSGVREDITDGENGYIVEIQDIKKIAEKVAYLDSHRERISHMGRNAHDCIYPKCQMQEHVGYWEGLLESWCSRFCAEEGSEEIGEL